MAFVTAIEAAVTAAEVAVVATPVKVMVVTVVNVTVKARRKGGGDFWVMNPIGATVY